MPIFIVQSDLAVNFLANSTALFFLIIYFSVLILGRGHQNLSDKELIAKCCLKSADWENFWREFQSRFGKTILFYIYQEFQNVFGQKLSTEFHEIVKDLRQDVYIKLLKNDSQALRNFNGKNQSSFLAYLHVTTKNLVKNYVNTNSYKKCIFMSKINPVHEQEDLQFNLVSMDTVDEIEKSIFQDAILEKIKTCYYSRKLERDILLFKLFYFKGFTAKEIASNSNFNLSASGVETIVNRIIQRLKVNLTKQTSLGAF